MPTEGQPTEQSSDLNRIPNEARDQQALLLDTLFTDLTGCLGIFSSVPGARKPIGSIELRSLTGAYFDYPTGRDEALAWAEQTAATGKELHLCPHLLTARRRIKENAAPVKALWADADEAELPEGFPLPTVCVQSSPGKRHLYWALRRVLEPEAAEALSRRLTHTIKADTGGWALTSLFRLPGTNNLKYPGEACVDMVAYDGSNVYHPREIEQYLEEEEKELIPIGEIPVAAVTGEKRLLTIDDLHRLSPRMQSLISLGNEAAGKPYETRSEADFAVAIAMFGAGFAEEAIWAVLSDPANGISAKHQEKGRHGNRYLKTTIDEARKRAQPAFPAARSTARQHQVA
jgi:hypothetical protein